MQPGVFHFRPNAVWLACAAALALGACGDTRVLQLGQADPSATAQDGGGDGDGTGGGGGTGGGTGGGQPGSGGDGGGGGVQPLTCTAPMADCDGLAANDCETDLDTSSEHCGACGNTCSAVGCVCVDGVRMLQCPAGLADCDGDLENGCEQDTTGSTAHCGACGAVCPSFGVEFHSSQCVDSVCVPSCELGHADCDGDLANGCESSSPC